MMMVNLELGRRLQWSRRGREGERSGHCVNGVRRDTIPWEKKGRENSVEKVLARCSTIYPPSVLQRL